MTEPTSPSASPDAPPALPGLIARAIGIITSPKATFEKVVQAPRTMGILALMALVIGGSQAAFTLSANGQQAMVDMQVQQMEKFTHQPTAPEVYDVLQKRAPYAWITTVIGTFIFLPIFLLILAGLLFVVFNVILGGTAEFKQVMAIIGHATVISALAALFGMAMNFAKGTMSTSPANIGQFLPMLPEGTVLTNFLGFVDLFSIWGTIVVAIGLGVLYRRKTANIAVGLFLVYGCIALGFAYFVSR
jgi:hypothetical protein